MRPSLITGIFRKYERDTGIVGVAYGPKEVGGRSAGNPPSVSFFVDRKLPEKGQRRVLSDGRKRLPKRIELNGTQVPTDVVVTGAATATSVKPAAGPARFQTGGRISNGSIVGTFGALVSSETGLGMFALTNQHIGLAAGTRTYFPDAFTPGGVIGSTDRVAGLVADEDFLGVIDKPGTYIDVDAALVAIPPAQISRFSAETPGIGTLAGIFEPDRVDFASFSASLIHRDVFSYSWKTGRRSGRISHVYYALRRLPDHTDSVAAFVVESTDGFAPGEPGDSGKLWMTRVGDRTLAVGLHSGIVIDPHAGTRFAIVSELSSLSRYLAFRLAATS